MSNLPILLTNHAALRTRELETLAMGAIERGEYSRAIEYLRRIIKERKYRAPQDEAE